MAVEVDIPGFSVSKYGQYLARSWKKHRRFAFRHNDYIYLSDGFTAVRSPDPMIVAAIRDGGLGEPKEDVAKYLDEVFDASNDPPVLPVEISRVSIKVSQHEISPPSESLRLFLVGDWWAAMRQEQLGFLDEDSLRVLCQTGKAQHIGHAPGILRICNGATRSSTVLILCWTLLAPGISEEDYQAELEAATTLDKIAAAIRKVE